MKRRMVIQKIKREAQRKGLAFEVVEMTRHTGIVVNGFRSALGRHSEVPDGTAKAFWKQFEEVLGKGWWR